MVSCATSLLGASSIEHRDFETLNSTFTIHIVQLYFNFTKYFNNNNECITCEESNRLLTIFFTF